ncbi:PAS and ANTAR domain-containing protein [Marinactinospora thermotolerans]|uniref:ANTAR domain-containing protein n=1 Tax=Marinactinospora thermotolerans DSM 45154 TaxID=1122192 RepID=A0A1T4JZT8_9ACTN|nr:PAS and ANTAR domain-containing protein [Marinactinospora thermotolerans]SJZ35629.1 ANTAR domain-containing protein [Marinactinospora thermotolerans DSM 45154]
MTMEDGRTARPEPAVDKHLAGSFAWDVRADMLWWSPGLVRIFGYPPGRMRPSIDAILEHVHADDLGDVHGLLARIKRDGGLFSIQYRIIDAQGRERSVLTMGAAEQDETATTVWVGGHASLAPPPSTHPSAGPRVRELEAENAQLRTELANAWAAHASLADIEQAKGMLMLACDCDAAQATAALKRISQHTNVKVRHLAAGVIAAITGRRDELPASVRDAILRELGRLRAGNHHPE